MNIDAKSTSSFLFQTYYRIDPWDFEPPVHDMMPLQIDLGEQEAFCLWIRSEQKTGQDEWRHCLLIQTLHRCDVPSKVVDVLLGETAADPDAILRDDDGMHIFPAEYRKFIHELHAKMDRRATELFSLARWRMGITGGPLALTSAWQMMRWDGPCSEATALAGGDFLGRQIPCGVLPISFTKGQDFVLNDEQRESLRRLHSSGQPLCHDLLREAWQRRESSPRSAVVMAVAAAEVGFKEAVMDLEPSTSWLLENLPSPPLDKMIRSYLEKLPTRNTISGKVRRPPKSLITVIKGGIELRNSLVHKAGHTVDSVELSKILVAIRDLLYLLDFYRGHEWALALITPDILAQMRQNSE